MSCCNCDDERLSDLEKKVDWMLERYGHLLVGVKVRCLGRSVRLETGIWPHVSHEWIPVKGRTGVVRSCSGGGVEVALDPDDTGKSLVLNLSVIEVERVEV